MIMNGTHINFSGPAAQPINMRTSPSYTIYCIHPLYIIIVHVKVKVLLIIIFSSHLKWLRPKKVPGAISEMLFASSLISSRESLKRTWGTGWSWGSTNLEYQSDLYWYNDCDDQAGTTCGASSQADLTQNLVLKTRMLRFSRHSQQKCRKRSFLRQKRAVFSIKRQVSLTSQ